MTFDPKRAQEHLDEASRRQQKLRSQGTGIRSGLKGTRGTFHDQMSPTMDTASGRAAR
jgi:hypothetical protein